MTRVATDDNEQVLLNFAATSSASQLDKLVRRFQRVDEKQQLIKQSDESAQRKLTCYQDEEGMWVINVPAEAGVEEKTTFSQKRADALFALAEHFIATATVDDENGGIQAISGS